MSDPDEFTIAWICALTTEFVAASALLDEEYPDIRAVSRNDENNYKLGKFGQHRVVIAVLPRGEYGLTSAASVARDMVHTFNNLRFGLMVGIGGGAPTKENPIRLGDVVVSQPTDTHGGVFQYDFGKALQDKDFVHTGHLNKPPRVLLSALGRLIGDHELKGHEIQKNVKSALERRPRLTKKYGRPAAESDRLYQSHVIHPYNMEGSCSTLCSSDPTEMVLREDRPSDKDDPCVFYGLIASANSLMKDARVRDRLARDRGILCFEMEAAGLMNSFPCLVIRGVCDYADTHKNKAWQGYAAMTAAAYAKELMARIAPEAVQSSKKLTDLVKEIQTNIKSIKNSTKSAADYNRKQLEQYASSQRQKCLQDFKTSAYEKFKDRNPHRIKGTCLWFFRHKKYVDWLQNQSPDLLWVTADPGCGKSVLARALVDDHEFSLAAQATVVCYFFFKDNEEQDSLATALCALLHQLFSKKPRLLSHAIPEWEKIGDKIGCETKVLWQILKSAAMDSGAGQVVCVLDALDECREKDRQQLMNLLCRFYDTVSNRSKTSGVLKFVVTGRPYDDQERTFSSTPEIRLRGENENKRISQEINLVIHRRLQELEKEIQLRQSTWQLLKKKLLEMEHRTYLWFYLAIEDIRETLRISLHPDEEVIRTVPSSINGAYEKILGKVPEKQREPVRIALSIILSARRPFSLNELSYALGIAIARQTDDLEKIVIKPDLGIWLRRCCRLFVYFSGSKVYLIHQTAKEFLLDRKQFQGQGWRGSFGVIAINEIMARTCIKALCSKDFSEYKPGKRGHHPATDSSNNNKHEFLSYCAENWTAHLRMAYDRLYRTMRDEINLLHDVNSKVFLAWFPVQWKALFPSEDLPIMTNIRLCAFTGHYRSLEQSLRDADIKLKICDKSGRNALYWSCFNGLKNTSLALINKGADVNTKCGLYGDALRVASSKGHEQIVRLLLDKGANVNATGGFHHNAIRAASFKGHKQIVRLLIDRGANVNAQGGFHGNALQASASVGHEHIVQLLIDKGANVNARGGNYGNALQAASSGGHIGTVRLLIDQGANLNARGGLHGDAIRAALAKGHKQIARLLTEERQRKASPPQ